MKSNSDILRQYLKTHLILIFLLELHYLPTTTYFAAIHGGEKIIVEKHEHFIKQTYRNRCPILTAQGPQNLIVPLTSKHGKVCITDVRIDYSQKWLTNHWRTIESAYRNAPFFEYYSDDLQKVLFKKQAYLYDLNFEFLTICLKWLKSPIQIQESMAYEKEPANGLFDLRNAIHPKKAGLDVSNFNPVPYTQVFGSKFVDPMSIIDLVFCEGPNAGSVIAASTLK